MTTPHLVKWHDKYAREGLLIIDVDNGNADSLETLREHARDAGLKFPIYHDADGATCKRYGVQGYPTAYLLDRTGTVVWEGHPAGSVRELESVIQRVLRE